MIGAIIGDMVGSAYEFSNSKNYNLELFKNHSTYTDDTILSFATLDVLLHQKDYTSAYHEWGNKHPNAGYGGNFRQWLREKNPQPYNSWGNGSGMRVSPIGFLCKTLDEVLSESEKSANVTHNHPEGIKGAQAISSAIFLARVGSTKEEIMRDNLKTLSLQEYAQTIILDDCMNLTRNNILSVDIIKNKMAG